MGEGSPVKESSGEGRSAAHWQFGDEGKGIRPGDLTDLRKNRCHWALIVRVVSASA